MTEAIKTCRYCPNPALKRRNAATCGGDECQAEHQRAINRARYAADPAVRKSQLANCVKNNPSVKQRMKTLMNELMTDPAIGKQGAIKTLSAAMFGPDRFVSPSTALKRRDAR